MPLQKARFRISEYNKKRKSRIGKQERRVQMASLSLTSMVDMFAILVIFLLTNSSTVSQWIEVGHDIQLPRAKADFSPPKAASIQISKDAIYGDQKMLISTKQAMAGDMNIAAIRAFLGKAKKDGYVNIVAHERVPFGIIRKVISTCEQSGFGNVNLAVQPKG